MKANCDPEKNTVEYRRNNAAEQRNQIELKKKKMAIFNLHKNNFLKRVKDHEIKKMIKFKKKC